MVYDLLINNEKQLTKTTFGNKHNDRKVLSNILIMAMTLTNLSFLTELFNYSKFENLR